MNHNHQIFYVSTNVPPLDGGGRLGRTGTLMIESAYIVITMIGPGVLLLPWAIAQLGGIIGPAVMIVFTFATYYALTLQAAACKCYVDDLNSGTSSYSYTDAVRANLGGVQVKLCVTVQYLNLFGTASGYTIASSMSMMAIARSICSHIKGHNSSCNLSSFPFMIGFGVVQIFLSQIRNFDEKRWLSVVAAIMSFTYPAIGLGIAIAHITKNGEMGGILTGVRVGEVTETQEIWPSFQALGVIAFSFSYVLNTINIQNQIESPPSRDEITEKAARISVIVASVLKIVYGCIGYAAFGNASPPENLLSDNTFCLADIANAAIAIHLVGAYQVFCQPQFASFEETAGEWFHCSYITKEITLPIPGFNPIKLILLRLLSRTIFVILTTGISMLVPFFNYAIGILGALKFWALTVYFPVQIHIAQNKIHKWSSKWFGLQLLSTACFIVSVVAAVGSVAGIVSHL